MLLEPTLFIKLNKTIGNKRANINSRITVNGNSLIPIYGIVSYTGVLESDDQINKSTDAAAISTLITRMKNGEVLSDVAVSGQKRSGFYYSGAWIDNYTKNDLDTYGYFIATEEIVDGETEYWLYFTAPNFDPSVDQVTISNGGVFSIAGLSNIVLQNLSIETNGTCVTAFANYSETPPRKNTN